MKPFNMLSNLFKKIRPRYLLSLDSQFYSLQKKAIVYRFKVFGEHTFPKFTFDDIRNDKQILCDIHPSDLLKISTEEYIASQKESMLNVSEILRDNKYKLSDNDSEQVFSGDEICDNILLIEKIKNIDLYKIAYNTGFNHGRQLAREITEKVNDSMLESNVNVISLQLVER